MTLCHFGLLFVFIDFFLCSLVFLLLPFGFCSFLSSAIWIVLFLYNKTKYMFLLLLFTLFQFSSFILCNNVSYLFSLFACLCVILIRMVVIVITLLTGIYLLLWLFQKLNPKNGFCGQLCQVFPVCHQFADICKLVDYLLQNEIGWL